MPPKTRGSNDQALRAIFEAHKGCNSSLTARGERGEQEGRLVEYCWSLWKREDDFMDEVLTVGDAFSSRSLPSPTPSIFTSLPLVSAFLAFTIAQFLKMIITWYKEKRWDSKRLLGSGGMPSSHSATVTALAAAIGFQDGVGGSSFALAVVLAAIVMYDASGIRLHAGKQAEVLNQIVCELPTQHPLSNVRPLHELLGHTPLQVAVGGILGCIVSFLMRNSLPT